MRRKLSLPLANQRGNTLMEASIGLLILTVILVAIYAGFVTTAKILHEGDEVLQAGQDAFAALETDAGTGGAEQSLTISTDDITINLRGSYQMSQDAKTGVTLYSFGSKSYDLIAEKMLAEAQELYDQMNAMTSSERKSHGYPEWLSNDTFRSWFLTNHHGDTYPTLDQEIPAQVLEEYGLDSTTYYIQPYFDVYGLDSSGDLTIWAKADQAGGWNAVLLYDPDEHAWYTGPIRNDRHATIGIANLSWTEIKALMTVHNWERIYP